MDKIKSDSVILSIIYNLYQHQLSMCEQGGEKLVHLLLATVEQLLVTVSMIVIIAAIGLIRFFNKYLFIN